jgi:hypothetical protein
LFALKLVKQARKEAQQQIATALAKTRNDQEVLSFFI